jgi:hypothetical protein
MSFLIKNISLTPGFCIYRPNADVNTYTFVEGTFQALEGNGTATLTFEGGYKYYYTLDYAGNHTGNVNTVGIFYITITKYYGSATVRSNNGVFCYTRAYSTAPDQQLMATNVLDAHSDFTLSFLFSAGGKTQSPSSTLSIWRFPI